MPNLFSIIMPAYNAESTIAKSIESVLSQTHEHWELIITNDCSTDSTQSIIDYYAALDSRIIITKNEKNLGVAKTRNISILKSKGTFISFLDTDDLWHPTKLEKQINLLNNGWNVVCSNYTTFSSEQTQMPQERISPPIITYSDMLKSNFIGNLTGSYNCKILGKIEQKEIGHEDYVMWLDIIQKSGNAFCIQEPLAKYRVSDSSLSSNKFKAIKWQWSIYRNELKFSRSKSLYYFSHYILNALRKRR